MSRQTASQIDDLACRSGTRLPGAISVQELYRIEEAKLRLGWPDAAYRAAVRRGLKVLKSGKRRYVTGEEILRFLKADNERRSA